MGASTTSWLFCCCEVFGQRNREVDSEAVDFWVFAGAWSGVGRVLCIVGFLFVGWIWRWCFRVVFILSSLLIGG